MEVKLLDSTVDPLFIISMAAGIRQYKKEGGLFCEGYAKAALDALLDNK